MKNRLFLLSSIVLLSVSTYGQPKLDIALKSGSQAEVQTKDQLQRLLKTFELSRFLFTTSVLIDQTAIPHSHPILTLNTRHLKDDDLLLSTFVHEELHWFLVQHNNETNEAIKDLGYDLPKFRLAFQREPMTRNLPICICSSTIWNIKLTKNCWES